MKGKKHHAKKSGGRIDMKVSGNPDVFKEADERKKGGRVKHKHVGKMDGEKPKHRMDRPGRKAGGRVGANKAPLSTAHSSTSAESMPKSQDGGASD